MQAIILAAGMGKRLKELTSNNTKCMVKVNGVSLIDRALHQLDSLHLEKIVLVVGYEGQKLIDYVETLNIETPIVFVNNPIYDKTNNIYSLYLAKDYLLEDDTLLLESDLIFETSLLQALIDDPRDTLVLVDKFESWMDSNCLKLRPDDTIMEFVPAKKIVFGEVSDYYATVNIYKFGKDFSQNKYVPFLDAYSKAMGNNEYYEQVLRVILMLDDPGIKAKRLNGQKWYEIDDVQDLDIASSIFSTSDEEQLELVQKRYGGYWRYPRLLDFCNFANPYYPSSRLIDEIKANVEVLLTQYPSGARVNRLLAGKNFGVHPEHILVGNGAAELIAALMKKLTGKTGFIRPTFEEYPNRWNEEQVVFTPANADFSYTGKELVDFFSDKGICNLVLINPDNPSGNYLDYYELLEIASWCEEKKITLVVDESFADFSDEADNTLIREDILQKYPHLVVMKSISKSYGVPGIRLGILASSNQDLLSELQSDIAIWNINSFGEFYMQIAEKYEKDYREALKIFRNERKRFISELSFLPGLRVIPTQANFVMIELQDGISAKELTRRLLAQYQIFIKDLSSKVGENYIRVAIRNQQDNEKLCSALRQILPQ